ncbi:hypothetical protein SKAU_G00212830 [Synaphobranchus kaupii]|uniref:Uncharacterized protein n=1 Tax=Synaphobranchus kaupii TaxID=118154 RepID=A0A9Q1IV38_SYNKA|nr:hypothetical protein SKAU_G00212830 [Synaphobranchus kaupii]
MSQPALPGPSRAGPPGLCASGSWPPGLFLAGRALGRRPPPLPPLSPSETETPREPPEAARPQPRGADGAREKKKMHESAGLEALAPGAASLSGAPGGLPATPSQGALEPDPPEAQPPALYLLLSRAATWLILPVAYACLKD